MMIKKNEYDEYVDEDDIDDDYDSNVDDAFDDGDYQYHIMGYIYVRDDEL